MAYLLDTNILVNAKRTYFGFDICPDFWGWLLHENNQGNIFSIDEVHEEIVNPKDRSNNPLPNTHQSYNDDLSQWAEGEGNSLFLTHNQESVNGYIELSRWINNHAIYTPKAKSLFLRPSNADPFLIGHALTSSKNTVVTLEVSDKTQREIKIPDVCRHFNVNCITPYDMLRELSATILFVYF